MAAWNVGYGTENALLSIDFRGPRYSSDLTSGSFFASKKCGWAC